jgi:hypothetical protein
MPAVLGLVPDALSLAVQNLLGDLIAGVRRQAVQRDRSGSGGGQQLVVELVAA